MNFILLILTISVLCAIFVTPPLVVLKSLNAIDISWKTVFAPVWIPIAIVLAIFILLAVATVILFLNGAVIVGLLSLL